VNRRRRSFHVCLNTFFVTVSFSAFPQNQVATQEPDLTELPLESLLDINLEKSAGISNGGAA